MSKFNGRVDYEGKRYIVIPNPNGVFSVWKEDSGRPYHVTTGKGRICTCPHHIHRLQPGRRCKHHKIVDSYIAIS